MKRPILMIQKRDGCVVERFDSLADAARALDREPNALLQRVHAQSLFDGACMLRYEDEWEGCEEFNPRANNRPVIATRGRGAQWFSSASAAAASLYISKNFLRCIIAGRARSRDGIRARYAVSTDDWPLLCADAAKLASQGVEPPDPLALGRPARVRRAV